MDSESFLCPRVFTCDLCHIVFSTRSDLNSHKTIVHDISVFKRSSSAVCCLTCGRGFSSISSLNRHLREVHRENVKRIQREKTITCQYCRGKFATKMTLSKHIKALHVRSESKEFICSECNHLCTSRPSIIKHLKLYHPFEEAFDDPSRLADILPEKYTYEVLKFNYLDDTCKYFYTKFTFEVNSLETGLMWLDAFANKNRLFMRPSKYRPSKKSHVLHKVKYCCRHNVAVNRLKGGKQRKLLKRSKQTFCPWTFFIQISRIRRSKNSDEPPSVVVKVQLKHHHNHDEKYSLQFLKPTLEVQNTFLNLFEAGFTPSKARQIYITQLKNEYEEQYSTIAEDASVVPSLGWVYRFYSRKIKDPIEDSSINFVELRCYNDSTAKECSTEEVIIKVR